jgi:hypothetical protein
MYDAIRHSLTDVVIKLQPEVLGSRTLAKANSMRRKGSRGQVTPGASASGQQAGCDGRKDHLTRRKKQIEAQIASIDARDEAARRKRETRANIIVGAVMRAHAALHPAFVPALAGILSAGLRRRADRELLASILNLPQLFAGNDICTPQQPTREQDGCNMPGITQPLRPRLDEYAAEITARR